MVRRLASDSMAWRSIRFSTQFWLRSSTLAFSRSQLATDRGIRYRPIDSIRAVEAEQYKRARLLDDKAA